MKTDRSIDLSWRIYAALLKLYPREHRDQYGPEMLQVFTAQCREAHIRRGLWGLPALWLRTLADLGISSLREHMAAPRFTDGLLEALPGKPLPWKGVLLVLLPGLVFLISQIAQLNGEDWFFVVLHRGAYVLILPVLLVWSITRKFPVWGLIPLGLLYRTLWSFVFGRFLGGWFVLRIPTRSYENPVISRGFLSLTEPINAVLGRLNFYLQNNYNQVNNLLSFAMLAALIAVVFLAARKGAFSKAGWLWLAASLGISLTYVMLQGGQFIQYSDVFTRAEITEYIFMFITWQLRSLTEVLILILAGVLLLRRYGSLALLLPLGYMIPSILYGRTTPEDSLIPFFMISVSVLSYRILLTLVAPVWILRSASEGGQKRAFGVTLLTALFFSMALNITVSLYYFNGGGVNDWSIFFFSISEQLLNIAAIGLALALYRSTMTLGQPQSSLELKPAEAKWKLTL